jgi:autotransporter-associated beta strand protein
MGCNYFACLALGLLGSFTLRAATQTWNGGDGTGSDFGASTNWVGGVAPANNTTSDTARFDTLTPGQPVISSSRSVAGIDFTGGSGGWYLGGSGTLTVGAGGIAASGQTSGSNSVGVAGIVVGAGSSWTLFNSAVSAQPTTFNLSSPVQLPLAAQLVVRLQRPSSGAGVGTLNVSGPVAGNSSGGLKLSGTTYTRNSINIFAAGSQSSYSGDTTISQVTVNFDGLANAGSNSSLGSAGRVVIGDNASFAVATYLGTGGSTDRPWLLGGTGGGGLNNNGSGPIAFNNAGSAVFGTGNRRLQLGGSQGGANSFGELIADAASGVTQVAKNDGGTWILANVANSYTGPTTLSGGILSVAKLDAGGYSSSLGASSSAATNLLFNGGTLNYTGAGDATDRLFRMGAGATIYNNGSGPLIFSGAGVILQGGTGLRTLTLGGACGGNNVFAPSLADDAPGGLIASLAKSGPTTWTLTGSNSYSGTTTVSGGTLLVDGSLAAGSIVLVQAGGLLGGTGVVGGPVTVQAFGTLRPGTSTEDTSTFTIANSLSLADGSLTVIAVDRARSAGPALDGMTSVTYGGTLAVTNVGEALEAGDQFTLFAANSRGGWFTGLSLPALSDGLSWDATRLAVDGTIRVIPTPPLTVAPSSAVVTSGDTVSFTASLPGGALVGYQWFDNHGLPIPAATNSSLTLSNVQPAHAGHWTVIASTGVVQATNAAMLSVAAPALPAIFPRGDTFLFTFYSTLNVDSAYVLANGATGLGPYYGDQSGPLSNAVSLNTRFIYKVSLPSMAGLGPADFDSPNFVWPTDETISNETVAIVQGACSNRNIVMWDLEPEELRCWKTNEMHFLALVSSLVHSNDPFHRPVYMYEPNNRTASQLAQTAVYQDLCGKGMYVNTEDTNYETSRIWARWSMDQELGGVARGNTSSIPAIVAWMAADPPPADFGLITNWCRHDLYLGLLTGGKAIRVWSGYRGRAGFAGTNFQAYLDGYLTVARDLNGLLHLAPIFLYGQPQTNVSMSITAGPATLKTTVGGATNVYPSLTWLSSVYAGSNYWFVVNSSGEAVTARFGGLPPLRRTDLFGGGEADTPGGSCTITLPGFGVQAFRFANGPAPPPILSLRVDSGTGGPPALLLSWPLSCTNYTLQGQTNPVGSGLGAEWAPVPGVVSNQISMPCAADQGSVFFRLVATPQAPAARSQ